MKIKVEVSSVCYFLFPLCLSLPFPFPLPVLSLSLFVVIDSWATMDRESSDCILFRFSRIMFVSSSTTCRDHEAIIALLSLSCPFPIKLYEEKKQYGNKKKLGERAAKKPCNRRKEKNAVGKVRKQKKKDLFSNRKMHIYTLYDRNKFESSFFLKKEEIWKVKDPIYIYIYIHFNENYLIL